MKHEELRQKKEKELFLRREKRIRQSRQSFWVFCRAMAPDFYKPDRDHLVTLCETLQAFYENRIIRTAADVDWRIVTPEEYAGLKKGFEICYKLMINMPPQHGKSRTLILFCQWAFGRNKAERIITCSYNDDLASDFSRYTRDGIAEEKNMPTQIVYGDIFPEIKIKDGNASFQKWALEGEFFSYKGAGVGGSITGKGATIRIVDDPIKDAETAYNENALEKIWRWYTGTFLSRATGMPKDILNMTRWSSGDPCGKVLDGPRAKDWYILHMEACDSQGNMLCEELLPKARYDELSETMDTSIFQANYHQKPVDIKGRLYQGLKEYDKLPTDDEGRLLFERVIAYGDTADEGNDWLCVIVAGVYRGELWILDVYYTQEPMERTEPETADLLVRNKVNEASIESNNGGKGFARNVTDIIWTKYQTRRVVIKWFHQTANKMARILTNSSFVINHVYFPVGWSYKWPQFYRAITTFQKEGKNTHDDAPDALTGLVEMLEKPKAKVTNKPKGW